VGRWGSFLGRLASLEIHWVVSRASRLVIGMWAVCMLSHESRSLANLRYRRVGERVEEVILGQDQGSFDTLWINVVVGFERLVEAAAGGGREASSRECQLWLCWTLGGMISLRCDILDERAEALRRSQLGSRVLDG
jgi:hypothetical protein